jgi:Undecaprenyl-phosphate glucose phosphotransferase
MGVNEKDPSARFREAVKLAASSDWVTGFDAIPETEGEKVNLSEAAREIASQLSDKPVRTTLLQGLLALTDAAAVILSGLLIYAIYVHDGVFMSQYLLPLGAAALFTVMMISAIDGYDITALGSFVKQFGRASVVWTAIFGAFATVAFFAKAGEDFSRVWFAGWYLMGFGYFVVTRFLISLQVRQWQRDGRLERRAVIVGGGRGAEELILSLESQPDNDIRICGIFDDRSGERSPPMVAGYPKLGTIAELVEFGRACRIDMLIVSIPITAEGRVQELLKQLWVLPVDIRLSAHANKMRFRPRAFSYVGSLPMLDVFSKPIADWDGVIKRVFDLTIGSLALVLLSPLMIATAIAVKLDSKGPVFFRQKRHGFNNEVISVWKFRSMYTDKSDFEVKQAVTKGDPRVTKVGRFIRKTSIDELPQLFNVLKGELSLVGPRPHAVNAQSSNRKWDAVVDGYFARHKVKPGITGWAQINGWRGEIDTPEKIRKRVEHDLYYIENWSVWFDLKIIVLTPIRLLNTENAY